MPVVKLFRSNPERIDKENPTALSLLQVEMDAFMLGLDVEVRQVNGPFVSYLPPEREGSPEKVIYTANVVYNQKPRT